MRALPHKRYSAGFTVTELVVVMVIIGILAAIGTPTFKYVTTSNRIAGEVNSLLGDMQFARSEAIKNGTTVSICTSSTGTTCSNSTSWHDGWIVFLDLNGDGIYNTGDTILRTQPAFSSTDTFITTATPAYTAITYNRMGYAPTGHTTTITINLHDATNISNFTRCLAISPIGYASTEVFNAGSPACT
jgi:type IV fimbrial biogenesis protein FimT